MSCINIRERVKQERERLSFKLKCLRSILEPFLMCENTRYPYSFAIGDIGNQEKFGYVLEFKYVEN